MKIGYPSVLAGTSRRGTKTISLSKQALLPLLLMTLMTITAKMTFANAAIVEYTFNITARRSRPPNSPDCYTDRDQLLVNGEFPGPIIRANVFDMLVIKINNMHPTESATIHYHGITMLGQPYNDGSDARSQCSIPPMQSQTNTFTLTVQDAGVHYWHGHGSLDRMDGLQGAIIIDNPIDTQLQELKDSVDEEKVLFLQDWYHRDGPSNRIGLDSVPFIWIGNAQSFLVNGKGRFPTCIGANTTLVPTCDPACTVENYLETIQVEAGKKYMLHVINAAVLIGVNMAIEGHSLQVVMTEGTMVEPLTVQSLDIGVAERYSVILEANADPANSYWLTTGVRFRSAGPMGYAIVQYAGAPLPSEVGPFPEHPAWDEVQPWIDLVDNLKAKNITKEPRADWVLSHTPDRRLVLVGNQAINAETGNLRWVVNNHSEEMDHTPLIVRARAGAVNEIGGPWPNSFVENTVDLPDTVPIPWDYTQTFQEAGLSTSLDVQSDTIVRLVEGDIVDIILQNARALNGGAEYHGWHLHGHRFCVIGRGNGTWSEADEASYNLFNPVLRDTVALLPFGWTAIRFLADNPGVWPMHCVMSAHFVMGMGFTVVVSPDLLPPPPDSATSCLKQSMDAVCPISPGMMLMCTVDADCCAEQICQKGMCKDCDAKGQTCKKGSKCCSGKCKKGKCK